MITFHTDQEVPRFDSRLYLTIFLLWRVIKQYTYVQTLILSVVLYIIEVYLTKQNSIQEEIQYRLKVKDSCYYSVQTLLSSWLLSMNLKIKIFKTIILPVVVYGCETWSLTLREEFRLRVFEKTILRRIFGPKRGVEKASQWELYSLYVCLI